MEIVGHFRARDQVVRAEDYAMCGIPVRNFRPFLTDRVEAMRHLPHCSRATEPNVRTHSIDSISFLLIRSLMEELMSRMKILITSSLVAVLALSARANG